MRLFGFRFGLVLGIGIGYVLGTRAGRRRYEQLARWARSLARSQPAQQIGSEVRDVAGKAGQAIEDKAAEGVTRITDRVRSGSDGGPDAPTAQA
ncbi:MAG: hypothetical protein ACQETV_07170 [Actinomycetota bacterium]